MGVQAEVDGAVVAPLADLVVHPALLDVAPQRGVLVAEHARRAGRRCTRSSSHIARDADTGVNAEEPVEPQLEQQLAPEQRRGRVQVARTIAGSAIR